MNSRVTSTSFRIVYSCTDLQDLRLVLRCLIKKLNGGLNVKLFGDRIGEILPYSLLDLFYSFIAKRIFKLCLQIADKLGLELG